MIARSPVSRPDLALTRPGARRPRAGRHGLPASFRLGLLLQAVVFQAVAYAAVPLGAEVPASARSGQPGAYLVAVYARGCLEPAAFERHWSALLSAGVPVVAVNPPDPGIRPLDAPAGIERQVSGEAALELRRALKVRAYPTTLVVGADHRVRAVLEGPVDAQQVRASLELVRPGP